MTLNGKYLLFLCISAIFVNFFGRTITAYIIWLLGYSRYTIAFYNNFTVASHYELGIVFSVITIVTYLFCSNSKINVRGIKKYTQASYFFRLTIILISLVYIYNLDFSLAVENRGAGQWDRGMMVYISRVQFFIYPFVAYYILSIRTTWVDYILISVLCLLVFASQIREGSRRGVVYFIFFLFMSLFRGSTLTFKNIFTLIVSILAVTVTASILRIGGGVSNRTVILGVVSTLGALGHNSIIWRVKKLVHERTGFLYGRTFFTYLKYLLFPSVILGLFGIEDISVYRASNLFNVKFFFDSDHGWGFMLIADFFWNFGYLGYALFIIFTYSVFLSIVKLYHSSSPLYVCISIILTVMFIASLREDLGFFIDHVVYGSVFTYILHVAKMVIDDMFVVIFNI